MFGARIHVKAQHLGEQRGGVLAAAKRIVARAAVAKAEIQITVRAKHQFAALVIAERLLHFQQNALGCQIGQIRVGGGDLEFADDTAEGKILRLGVLVRRIFLVVINVEQMVRCKAGMKGDAQQAAFVFAAGLRIAVFDVEKFLRVAAVRAFFDNQNFPRLIDDEHPARTVRRLAHPDRAFIGELGKNRLECDLGQRLRLGGKPKAKQDGS